MRYPPAMRAAWSAVVLSVALLAVACASGGGVATDEPPPVALHGTQVTPAVEMPGFELVGTDGQPLRSDDLRGRYVAVYFGYTHCPDVCPLTLSILKQAIDRLDPAEQDEVAVLMVAVDPERDTPEVLARYMGFFDPDFLAATGEPERVHEVLNSWGIQVTRQPQDGDRYSVSHPAAVYLLDREGRWVLAFDHSLTSEDIAADLHHLIAYGPPQAEVTAPGAGAGAAAASDSDGAARASGEERWFFALGDGSVLMREADGSERQVLPPWSEQPSPDDLAQGRTLGSREVAYDATAQTLWFADTHEAIHSINVTTGEPGLSIEGFADAALPGCGVADLSREFALLPGGRLIVPTLLGTTLVYHTSDGSMATALSPTAFGMPLLGDFRPFIAEGTSGWFADTTGILHAFDPHTWTQPEASLTLPDAPRTARIEIALSPDGGTIYYLAEDATLRAWDTTRAEPAEPPVTAPPDTRAIAVG
ncbi:MAG: SCO family protein [Dehalococcoidia bacterium]|nr:SCO family protein [Dehalococcoidia bacterium]